MSKKKKKRINRDKVFDICAGCGNLCEAKMGVFETLCETCLAIKREIKAKEHPTLFN